MKKLISACITLMLTTQLWALNSVSSIPMDQKGVITKVITSLSLPNTVEIEEKIYLRLKPFLNTDNWNVRWTTNTSATNSKIEHADAKICDMMIYNNNRVVNNTFIYFQKEKQLFVNTKEFVETKSSDVLEKFEKTKKNSEYIKKEENDNYAYFQLKGYMDYETFHVKSPVGMLVYESTVFIDIK